MKIVYGKFIAALVNAGIICDNDRELYIFAIRNLTYSILTWGTLLLFALFTNRFLYCVLYIICYLPLREYAGGFHQKTRVRCYINSIIIFTVIIFGSYHYEVIITPLFLGVGIILSLVCFIVLVPVETPEKPLTQSEHLLYRKKTMLFFSIEIVLTGILFFIGTSFAVFWVFSAIMTSSCLVSIGAVKNKIGSQVPSSV